jgi:CheY-like chemotaxis protein
LILVADDSPTIQRKAQAILQGEGFEVETVSNGVAAIKKLPKLQPILVLADVSMPGKDGYEVCEFVKTSADFRDVPVLLVGSDLEPYDEQRGAQVRADGIIKKPFAAQDLIAVVAKFTGLGEAQAPQATLPETLAASSPEALPEVPPMGPGPELSAGSQEQDLAAPPAGVPFAEPPLDEMLVTPTEPLPDISFQPSPEPGLESWPPPLPERQPAAPPEDVLRGSPEPSLAPTEPFAEFAFGVPPELALERIPEGPPEPELVRPELISETTPEAMPEPSQVIAEPTAERIPEGAPEPALISPELISETAPEAMPEPSQIIAEPTAERVLEAGPEPALVSPELIPETAPEAASEQVSVVPEPVAEAGLTFTPESVTETVRLPAEAAAEAPPAGPIEEVLPPTEPILAEKQVEPIPSPPPSPDLVTPEADRTVTFRAPAEITEPVLVDELAAGPPVLEPPPLVEEQRRKPMVATHLDSFSLAEAAEGQVYVPSPEAEAGPAPKAEVAQPGGAPAGATSVVDPEWVHAVVHKVVMKMAPPALTPELVEELVRLLSREITAELDEASPQAY